MSADLRAGDIGTIRLTAGLPRSLTFVGLAGIIDGTWTATVGADDLTVNVVGDDVSVSFPGDTSAGRFALLADGEPQIVGRVWTSLNGTQSPDDSVPVRLAEQTVTVTVVAGSLPTGLVTWPEEN